MLCFGSGADQLILNCSRKYNVVINFLERHVGRSRKTESDLAYYNVVWDVKDNLWASLKTPNKMFAYIHYT